MGETDPPQKKSTINHLELNTFPQGKEQDAIRKWDGEDPYAGWEASKQMTFVRPEERQGNGTQSVEGTGQAGEAAGEQAGGGQEWVWAVWRHSRKLQTEAGLTS